MLTARGRAHLVLASSADRSPLCPARAARSPLTRRTHSRGRWLTRTCAAAQHHSRNSSTAVTTPQWCCVQLPHPAALSLLHNGTCCPPPPPRRGGARAAHRQTRQSSCAARRRPPRRRRPAAGSCSRWCACPPCTRARLRAARPVTLGPHAPGKTHSPSFLARSRRRAVAGLPVCGARVRGRQAKRATFTRQPRTTHPGATQRATARRFALD
jgi:hypothetical protein